MLLGEFFVKDLEKARPTLVATFLLYGGYTKLSPSFDSFFQGLQAGLAFGVKR